MYGIVATRRPDRHPIASTLDAESGAAEEQAKVIPCWSCVLSFTPVKELHCGLHIPPPGVNMFDIHSGQILQQRAIHCCKHVTHPLLAYTDVLAMLLLLWSLVQLFLLLTLSLLQAMSGMSRPGKFHRGFQHAVFGSALS